MIFTLNRKMKNVNSFSLSNILGIYDEIDDFLCSNLTRLLRKFDGIKIRFVALELK